MSLAFQGATRVIVQPHQILRQQRKMTRMLDPHHIWNVSSNLRSNKCHRPTSPNTAPATQNDSHAWSSPQMKRQLQFAEQQVSAPSNLTKYCACHAKWFTLRGRAWSKYDPSMNPSVRNPPRNPGYFSRSPRASVLKPITFQLCFQISPSTAPATKSDAWTSPNTAPATKNFTKYCACHEKWLLSFTKYCACREKWHLNFTMYCACHEKFLLLASTITWRFLLLDAITGRVLLLDSTITWRFLLLDHS